ncbi:GPP34 family phosphoprotein [Lentilactobacillus parabuchneri]|uniref:GPP34 family phosphoprotein n=1 Tax=Lentilactobacillus parabuchneri TaxID=152331 RepID=UPI00345F08D0
MKGLNYTQEFVLCVLNQKPKISAFKERKVAACLLLSEIVELLRDGTMALTPANRMVIAPVNKAPKDYLVPLTEDIKKSQPQSVNNYVRDAVLSVRKRRITKIAQAVCDSLVKDGYLEEDHKTYYDNQTLTDRILKELYSDAVSKNEPSEQNSMLAILLVNSGLIREIFPKDEAQTVELRLKEVMKSDQYHLISDVTKRINQDLTAIIEAVLFAKK